MIKHKAIGTVALMLSIFMLGACSHMPSYIEGNKSCRAVKAPAKSTDAKDIYRLTKPLADVRLLG